MKVILLLVYILICIPIYLATRRLIIADRKHKGWQSGIWTNRDFLTIFFVSLIPGLNLYALACTVFDYLSHSDWFERDCKW